MTPITTTQDNFHPMKGHVAHGTVIRMNNGKTYRIMATMAGWEIRDSTNNVICPPIYNAAVIAEYIFTA